MFFYPMQDLSNHMSEQALQTAKVGVAVFRLRDHPTAPGDYELQLIEEDLGRQSGDLDQRSDPIASLVMTVASDAEATITFASEWTPAEGRASNRTLDVAILLPDERCPDGELVCRGDPASERIWNVTLPQAVFAHERDHRLELFLVGPDAPGDEVDDDMRQSDSSLWLLMPVHPMPRPSRGRRASPRAGGGGRRGGGGHRGGDRRVEEVDLEGWHPPDPGPNEWTEWREPDQSLPAIASRRQRRRHPDDRVNVRVGESPARLEDTSGRVPEADDAPTLHGFKLVRNGEVEWAHIYGRRFQILGRCDRVALEGEDDEGHLAVMGFGFKYNGRGADTYRTVTRARASEFREDSSPRSAYRLVCASAYSLLGHEGGPTAINSYDSKVFTFGPGHAGASLNRVFRKLTELFPETAQELVDGIDWFEDELQVDFHRRFPPTPTPEPPPREREYRHWTSEARALRLDLPNMVRLVLTLEHPTYRRHWVEALIADFTERQARIDHDDSALRSWAHEAAATWAGQELAEGSAHSGETAALRPVLAMACYLNHGRPAFTPDPLRDAHHAMTRAPNDPTAQLGLLLKLHAQRIFSQSKRGEVGDFLGRRSNGKVNQFLSGMRVDSANGAWDYQRTELCRTLVPAFNPHQGEGDAHTAGYEDFTAPAGAAREERPRWPRRPPYAALEGHVWFDRGGGRFVDFGEFEEL